MQDKREILLIGCGGVGTMAAVNLEAGGAARVTAVLRSNYNIVKEHGFHIRSCEHGTLDHWRPSQILSQVPDVAKEPFGPYDYIVCSTKNVPDMSPTAVDLVRPAVTEGHTVIVLIQNGLNIEKPFHEAFPKNAILSGVSLIGSNEPQAGHIEHDDKDILIVSSFNSPGLDSKSQLDAADDFVRIYSAAGKCTCYHDTDVGCVRWKKLIYNACINPVAAITDMDSGRLQLADGAADNLLFLAMEEVRAAAKACGHELPADISRQTISREPVDMYLPPSMLGDVRKNNLIEYENLVGEPLREGLAKGVPMPTLTVLYNLCRAIQWRIKASKGLIQIPQKRSYVATD